MKNLQEDSGVMMCAVNGLQNCDIRNVSPKNISRFVDVTFSHRNIYSIVIFLNSKYEYQKAKHNYLITYVFFNLILQIKGLWIFLKLYTEMAEKNLFMQSQCYLLSRTSVCISNPK